MTSLFTSFIFMSFSSLQLLLVWWQHVETSAARVSLWFHSKGKRSAAPFIFYFIATKLRKQKISKKISFFLLFFSWTATTNYLTFAYTVQRKMFSDTLKVLLEPNHRWNKLSKSLTLLCYLLCIRQENKTLVLLQLPLALRECCIIMAKRPVLCWTEQCTCCTWGKCCRVH